MRDVVVDHKDIGTYSSEERAKQAIERVKDQPGFREPNGYFTIEPRFLNVAYWLDDRVTVVRST